MTYPKGDREAWADENLRYDYDLDANSIVFDLGCFMGSFTEEISRRYDCLIYSFEPIKEYYDICIEKFKSNNKIKLYQTGLAEDDFAKDFSICRDASSMFGENLKQQFNVNLIKIDRFMIDNKIDCVDLLKMNIEGGEYGLLSYIIQNNLSTKFKNIQVQFHENAFSGWRSQYDYIIKNLPKTHHLTYHYEFKFENWKLN